MLKITMKPVTGFNVTINGNPVSLLSTKFRTGLLGEMETLMRAVREEGCDSMFSFLEYKKNVVVFFKHFNGRDISIVGTGPIPELLACLKEIESSVAWLYAENETA